MSTEVAVADVRQPDLLTREERDAARNTIRAHIHQYELTCMDLGRLLWLVSSGRWYEEWGFESFEDYLDRELGFALRKARYQISVWQKFGVDLSVPVEVIQKIGWFKAALIAPIVTPNTLDAWLERARTTTAARLQEEVRRARELVTKSSGLPLEDTGEVPESPAPAPTTAVEAPAEEWQPTDAAAETVTESYPEVPSVEVIHSTTRSGDALPPDRIAAVMKFPLFQEQYGTVIKALDAAGTMTGSASRSHQLDTICTMYLSGIPTDDFSKGSTLAWLVERLEEQFGVSLVVLPTREPRDKVHFLRQCINELERNGAR